MLPSTFLVTPVRSPHLNVCHLLLQTGNYKQGHFGKLRDTGKKVSEGGRQSFSRTWGFLSTLEAS